MKVAVAIIAALLAHWPTAPAAAMWTCHGPKPGHPTAEERVAFVREASELAVRAEARHGVPASALVAIAIAESNYGWNRLALEANNLFAWKAGPSTMESGHGYTLPCGGPRGARTGFVRFASRGEAFDHVAGKLASIPEYGPHTERYRAARKQGDPARAVDAWVQGISTRYSRKPKGFVKKIQQIMNHPLSPGPVRSPDASLYLLSATRPPAGRMHGP